MFNTAVHRIFLAAALFADAWRSEHHDSTQLAAMLAQQKAALDQAADREKQRDNQLAAALGVIASQKRAVQTPRQAAIAIPSVLPPLPLPISIHIPDLSASPKPVEDLPATISIPQPDLKPLYDSLQECRAAMLDSATTKKDLADEQLQAASLLHERDAAVAAAHDGTFWVRLKREAKWFAIGIALGAAATAAAHH